MVKPKSRGIQGTERKSYWVDPESLVKGKTSLCEHAKSKLLYNELAPIFLLAIARDTKKEVDFLNEVFKQFRPTTKEILDLGCGVGRHDELLSRNYKYLVTGIDSSKRMIEHAKVRCPKCKYFVMDLRNISFHRRFDAAFCMWTTFNYLSDPKDMAGFFENVQKILSNNGLLIIDMNNYGRQENNRYIRSSSDDRYDVTVNVSKKHIGDVNEALYSYCVKDRKTGKEYKFLDQELNRIYTLDEVINASKQYFRLQDCLGDYDIRAKFEPATSERIIMLFQKKE